MLIDGLWHGIGTAEIKTKPKQKIPFGFAQGRLFDFGIQR